MRAIRVENLSKKFSIEHQQQPSYKNFRDVVSERVALLGRKMMRPFADYSRCAHNHMHEEFWALKDVSFDIEQGERVAIIGRNGAGKSTLLKILSRITVPTAGKVTIKGRIASLLEVGTGFHPELSGRENIFLNGAILGMGRAEIRRKFDEIVAFAEVEQFLDTPVKRYSSGMYVRLAFAVAAHLDPEVLIIDEVLAVGDASFQSKCMGKIEEAGNEGRTVIFVSHNMGAVKQLCSRSVLLHKGMKIADASTGKVIDQYLDNVTTSLESSYTCTIIPNEHAWLFSVNMTGAVGPFKNVFFMSEEMLVVCLLKINAELPSKLTLSVQIKEINDSAIFHFPNGDDSLNMPQDLGLHRITVRIPPLNLYPGKYILRLCLCQQDGQLFNVLHVVENIVFMIEQDFSMVTRPLPRQAGLIFLRPQWNVSVAEHENAV